MPRTYKTKTVVQKDGSISSEQIPIDIVDDSPDAKAEDVEEQEEEELTPDEERYIHVARKLAGSMLKFKVFRIVDGGDERYCGSLAAEQFDQDDPVRSIQTRYGGGSYKVYFPDPENPSQDFSAEYQIEGEPRFGKEEAAAPGGGVTLQLPKQGDNGNAVVASMMNFMSVQLQESQKTVNALMLKLADTATSNRGNQQQATIAGLSLDQLAVIKELFADRNKREDTGEKLREWLGLIKSVVETVPTIIGQQSEASGWLQVAQTIAPKVSEAIGTFVQAKTAGVPAGRVAVVPSPAQQQQQQVADANVVRQVFESMYLQPLVQAASEDVDPYVLTFNFKAQMGGDTTGFLPHLGLQSVPEFYERYPVCKEHAEWFNEFFFYMLNPTAKPPADDDEEEEAPNGEDRSVVIEAEIKKGASADHMAKMRAAKAAKKEEAGVKQ